VQPSLEDDGGDEEQHKDQDLQYHTAEDNVIVGIDFTRRSGFGKQTTTTTLDHEAENIATNKNLGEPIDAND